VGRERLPGGVLLQPLRHLSVREAPPPDRVRDGRLLRPGPLDRPEPLPTADLLPNLLIHLLGAPSVVNHHCTVWEVSVVGGCMRLPSNLRQSQLEGIFFLASWGPVPDTINSPKEQSAFYYDPAHVRNGPGVALCCHAHGDTMCERLDAQAGFYMGSSLRVYRVNDAQ